jgi:hypothetical protein
MDLLHLVADWKIRWAPPELAGSWPAAEVGKREGGRRRWDLGVSMGLRLELGGAVEGGREEAGVGMGWSFWSPPARILGVNFGRSMEFLWMAKILFRG